MGVSSFASSFFSAGSSSSTSSTAWAESTQRMPFMSSLTLTFTLAGPPSAVWGMPLMEKVAISGVAPLTSAASLTYAAFIPNGCARMNVSILVEGRTLCWTKTSFCFTVSCSISAPEEVPDQERAMGYGLQSSTWKSRTRKLGEIMAPISAHPFDTASSEFIVRFGSLPKKSLMVLRMSGERVALPTISISWMSSKVSFESATTCLTGSTARSRRGAQHSVSTSVSTNDEKSRSSWRHSTLMGSFVYVVYPLSCCFTLSMAESIRITTLGLSYMLRPVFVFHSFAKWSNSALSMSLPPRLRSKAVATMVILLLLNLARHTWVEEWPISKNKALRGGCPSSGSSGVRGSPQHRAVAAVSLSRRNTLSPAIVAASSIARRW
mmetsp:Transcript_62527/g.129903  ORF Transcript_62527/g.129903 Transcript_62527/m.129903 type:complete len:379 (-) Transcript_62527:578-1714(-)